MIHQKSIHKTDNKKLYNKTYYNRLIEEKKDYAEWDQDENSSG